MLDAGSGIGGTARYIADQCGCKVTAVDLTEEYCQTATWLNQLVGLDEKISIRQADVTDLPFADASFDVVFREHVQMNVSEKAGLYREARRVLVSGGVGWPYGTSPLASAANRTIRCHGPTDPRVGHLIQVPTNYVLSSSPRGSPSSTGAI